MWEREGERREERRGEEREGKEREEKEGTRGVRKKRAGKEVKCKDWKDSMEGRERAEM